jgi:hypothetical protein
MRSIIHCSPETTRYTAEIACPRLIRRNECRFGGREDAFNPSTAALLAQAVTATACSHECARMVMPMRRCSTMRR